MTGWRRSGQAGGGVGPCVKVGNGVGVGLGGGLTTGLPPGPPLLPPPQAAQRMAAHTNAAVSSTRARTITRPAFALPGGNPFASPGGGLARTLAYAVSRNI